MTSTPQNDEINCWLKIADLIEDKDPIVVFRSRLRLRCVCQRLNSLFKQEYIDNYFHNNLLRNVSSAKAILRYFYRKTKDLFINGSPEQVENFLCHKYTTALPNFFDRIQELFMHTLQNTANVKLIERLLSTTFPGNKRVSFTSTTIIRAILYANERPNNDLLVLILPQLIDFFDNTDPEPARKLMEAVQQGVKLNFEECYDDKLSQKLNRKFDENKVYKSSKPYSKLLLPLLRPKKQSLIIPEGNLLKSSHSEISTVCQIDETTLSFKYKDRHYREQSVTIQYNNGQYNYEGYSTDNFYELIIRTSLQSLMPCSYTRVALTENLLSTPLWLFGSDSIDENKQKMLTRTPDRNTMLATHYGSRLQIYISTGVPTNKAKPVAVIDPKDLVDFCKKNQILFGFYNDGNDDTEDLTMYAFYRILINGDIKQIKQFWETNRMNLTKFKAHPCPIKEYLEYTTQHIKDAEVVHWLLETFPGIAGIKGDTLHVAVKFFNYSELCEFAKRGAKCDALLLDIVRYNHRQKELTLQQFGCLLRSCEFIVGPYSSARRDAFDYLLQWCYRFNRIDRTRSTLVRLAWKFGNEDNCFKRLPKELIQVILSYEGIDEPEWFELAEEFLLKRSPASVYQTSFYIPYPFYEEQLQFICKFIDRLPHDLVQSSLKFILSTENFDLKENRSKYWKYLLRIGKWCKSNNMKINPEDYANNHKPLGYCLRHESAFESLVDLIDIFGKDEIRLETLNGQPLTWIAVAAKNRKATKLLADNKMLPLLSASTTLETYLVQNDAAVMIDFLKQLHVIS